MKTQQQIIDEPIMRYELSDKEISRLEGKILSHFKNNPRFDRHNKMVIHNNFKSLNNYLGLAYTSSSSWAGLWVCNEEVYFDVAKQWIYQGFGVDMGGFSIAYLTDKDENELYIYI